MIAKLSKCPTPKNGVPHPCPYPQDPHIIEEHSQEARGLNRSATVVPNQRRNDDQRPRPHARGQGSAGLGVPPGPTTSPRSRRSPCSPSLSLGLWEQAVAWFRRAIEANRNYPHPHFVLGVALAHLGRLDEAHAAVKAGLVLNPAFTISRARASWTTLSDDSKYLAGHGPFFELLRKAGVPEE